MHHALCTGQQCMLMELQSHITCNASTFNLCLGKMHAQIKLPPKLLMYFKEIAEELVPSKFVCFSLQQGEEEIFHSSIAEKTLDWDQCL